MSMERVEAPAPLLTWLADRPAWEATTGYDAAGWQSSTWILHARYENPSIGGEESLDALLDTLSRCSIDGPGTDCVAFYASLPAGDFDNPHVWRGPLSAVPELLEERGGPYAFSATNLWPTDRSWFVWTDYDLLATKVSGAGPLVEAVKSHPALETVDWSTQPR
ncbi:hypothetical protein ACLQ3D_24475 [Micromonospora vinacea]|uniref:hypothetical protein n=1 Tax=Micromonospora vinacea TaxID=709878 RepID=UPI003CF8D196